MTRSALAVVLVLLVSGCASGAYERGRAKAEDDIMAGEPHLTFLGLPSAEASALDPATGLLRWGGGCVVSDERLAFVKGYNDATMDALRSGRLDQLKLGHKHTTWEAVAARFRAEEPVRLGFKAAAIDVPGGRFRLEYAPYDDHPDAVRFIYVTDTRTGRRQRTVNPRAEAIPVLFDHDGTTLLVRDEQFRRYLTIDLPRAAEMQVLADPDRGY
ncbi:MAG: hypothetical protein ACYTDY_05270 [Planctomycetota bacterium]|jgi:hypothetical protein